MDHVYPVAEAGDAPLEEHALLDRGQVQTYPGSLANMSPQIYGTQVYYAPITTSNASAQPQVPHDMHPTSIPGINIDTSLLSTDAGHYGGPPGNVAHFERSSGGHAHYGLDPSGQHMHFRSPVRSHPSPNYDLYSNLDEQNLDPSLFSALDPSPRSAHAYGYPSFAVAHPEGYTADDYGGHNHHLPSDQDYTLPTLPPDNHPMPDASRDALSTDPMSQVGFLTPDLHRGGDLYSSDGGRVVSRGRSAGRSSPYRLSHSPSPSIPDSTGIPTRSPSTIDVDSMLSVPGEASSQVMTPGVRRASINRRKNPGNFICDWCSETFTRSSNLRDHYRAHNRERPYPCSTCEQTFTRRSDMRRHARAKH